MAQFKKGQSGNVAGKPKGAKDKRTELRELLRPHAPALLEKAVNMAMEGDPQALRLCLDRICPAIKSVSESAPIEINLSGTPSEQSQAVLMAAAQGKISIDDAGQLLSGIAAHVRIIEATELEQRLQKLEQAQQEGGNR